MRRAIFGLFLGLCVLAGPPGSARAAPMHMVIPAHPGAAVLKVDGSPLEGMGEIFHMDPPHLLFLGAGIIGGALIIGPGLGLNEVFGVVIGVIGSEYLYHSFYRSGFPWLRS